MILMWRIKRTIQIIILSSIVLPAAMTLSGCVSSQSLGPAYSADIERKILEKGHDPNVKERLNNDVSLSPLSIVVLWGQHETVKKLIDKGADIDAALLDLKQFASRQLKYLRYPANKEIYDRANSGVEMLNRLKSSYSPPVIKTSTPVLDNQSIKSDVDSLPAITTKPNKNAYAIVIGIEQYRQKLPKADFAVSDAKLMADYLSKVMGYQEENIVTLTNENATKGDLEKYLDKWLKNVAEKNGTVFVYYSGHGAPNPATGDAYLVPYDGDPAFIEQTGYSLKRLYENLAKLPAKNVIVALDSCFSGAGGKSVAAKGSRALVRVEKTSARNIAVLTASQDNQISSSYEDKGHGVFTYFLLKGIKELLGEDSNSTLELGELYNYLKPQVERTSRRLYNNEQTPQLMIADEQMKKIGLR